MTEEIVVCELWNPFKTFRRLADDVICGGNITKLGDLRSSCQNLHLRFLSPLKNPPKDASSRAELEKAKKEGILIPGSNTRQVLGEAIVEEALVLADMFGMNEVIAMDLVLLGEAQMVNFPGLPRGLVAVLLYFDGRRDLVHGLASVLNTCSGRTWDYETEENQQVCNFATNFRDELVKDGFVGKILGKFCCTVSVNTLKTFSVTLEWETLSKNRALGNARHRRLVLDILKDLERTCAMFIFYVSAQAGLGAQDAIRLLSHLKSCSLQSSADGSLNDSTMILLMAALYALIHCDLADGEEPRVSDETGSIIGLVLAVHPELSPRSDKSGEWASPEIKSVLQLAWGCHLRHIAQIKTVASDPEVKNVLEEDEAIVDAALEKSPFCFVRDAVVGNAKFHTNEFFVRQIHGWVTDFIVLMPMKVKELRNLSATLTGFEVSTHEPAARSFLDLVSLMTALYSNDPLDLCLSLDYWVSPETMLEVSSRQVALQKFVRMSGEVQTPTLLVPFVDMLSALSANVKTAPLCFELLRNGPRGLGSLADKLLSWDHFIRSIERYHSGMCLERGTNAEGSFAQSSSASITISSLEVRGLKAVLGLIEVVGRYSCTARVEFFGRGLWNLPSQLLGFVACPVPLDLKAAALKALAALCPNTESDMLEHDGATVARILWLDLEARQLLRTTPIGPGMPLVQTGDIRTELEEVESRQEDYSLTRAFIELLTCLTKAGVPADVGSQHRNPGFEPYLTYVIESVLLKFATRSYKDRHETWRVASVCFQFLTSALLNYPILAEDFKFQHGSVFGSQTSVRNLRGPSPGFLVMNHALTGDGDLVRIAMLVVEECLMFLEKWDDLTGAKPVLDAGLSALQFLGACLESQEPWLALYRELLSITGSFLSPPTPIDRALVSVNPRHGKPNYLLTIAKFMPFCAWTPGHAKEALSILHRVAGLKAAQVQMVTLFTSPGTKEEILHGFVQCLDEEENEVDGEMEEKTGVQNRQRVLRLLLKCLSSTNMTGPNLAHFLLGFNVNEPLYESSLQNPGVMNTPRSCLHAVIGILDSGMDVAADEEALKQPVNTLLMPTTATLCYQILFKLCANEESGPSTLRYLRNNREFLLRHLQMLPFHGDDIIHLREQMGWLLRTIAVDLTVSASRGHRAHLARLVTVLLNPDVDPGAEGHEVTLPVTVGGSSGRAENCRIYALLKSTGSSWRDEQATLSGNLSLELLDVKYALQLLEATRAVVTPGGASLFNIARAKLLLERELASSGILANAAEYPAFRCDIQRILQYATNLNVHAEHVRSLSNFMDGWRQVTEALFYVDPPGFVGESDKQRLIVQIIESLLEKSGVEGALLDLTKMSAGTLLVLVAALRMSLSTEQENLIDSENNVAVGRHCEALSRVTSKLIALILQNHDQERMRTYLYAVLGKLVMMGDEEGRVDTKNRGIGGGKSSVDFLLKEYLIVVFSTFGDSFLRAIANDCSSGHEVVRMAALSCLTQICILGAPNPRSSKMVSQGTDRSLNASSLVASRSFLQPLLSSLISDDRKLGDELALGSTGGLLNGSLRTIEMFRARLSLLSAAALTGSREAVTAMLDAGLVTSLAQISSLQRHPPSRGMRIQEDKSTNHEKHHRSILVPALRSLGAVFNKSGMFGVKQPNEGRRVASIVLGFLASFHETVVGILTTNQPLFKLPELKETQVLTEIILLLAGIDPMDLTSTASGREGTGVANLELHSRYMTYRRFFLLLLSKYLLSDRALAEVDTGNELDAEKIEARYAYLAVIANILQFAARIVAGNKRTRRDSDRDSALNLDCLFGPSLVEGTAREVQRINESQMMASGLLPGEQATSLGVVVYQLKKACSLFLNASEKISKLVTSKEAHSQAVLYSTKREKKLLGDIIEGSSFLITHHLHYYLIEAATVSKKQMSKTFFTQPTSTVSSLQNTMSGLRREDLVQMKSDMGLALGEQLFVSLKQVSTVMTADRRDALFLETQTKRLRRITNQYSS